MNKNHARACVLAASVALSLSGVTACGSDGSPEHAAPSHEVQLPTVSKAAFADRGNQVCRTSAEAIGSKFRAMSTPPRPAELTAAYDNMLMESYKLPGDLLAIGPPMGQERELLDLLVQLHEVTATVEKRGQQAFFADEDSDPWATTVATLVSDFDLKDCGHGN